MNSIGNQQTRIGSSTKNPLIKKTSTTSVRSTKNHTGIDTSKLNESTKKLKAEFSKAPALEARVVGESSNPNKNVILAKDVSIHESANKDNLSPAPTKTKSKFASGLTFMQRMSVRKNQAKQSMGLTKERIDTFKKDHPVLFKSAMAVKNTISFIASSAKTITVGHFFDTASTIKSCNKEISLAKKSSADLTAIKDEKIAKRNELKKSIGGAIKQLKSKASSSDNETTPLANSDGSNKEVSQGDNSLTNLIDTLGNNFLNNEKIQDGDVKDILKELKSFKDNDTTGDFINLYNELKSQVNEFSDLESEINTIDQLSKMDDWQKTSFIADKRLEQTSAIGNSMWSFGFTASFLFPPASGLAALGGTVFLASKALKFVNNMARTAGTKAKMGLNQSKINETAKNLKEAVTNLNDSCQGKGNKLESILRNPRLTTEDKQAKINDLFKEDSLNKLVASAGKTVQGCIDDIKDLLETVMTDEAQAGIRDDALKTGCWDAINMVTWAGLIYAGGGGAEAMRGSSGAESAFQNFGDAFMDHMSNPTNFTDQVMGADQFAQSMVEPSGIQGSTTGMADWITEAVLFKMEATVQGGDGGKIELDIDQKTQGLVASESMKLAGWKIDKRNTFSELSQKMLGNSSGKYKKE